MLRKFVILACKLYFAFLGEVSFHLPLAFVYLVININPSLPQGVGETCNSSLTLFFSK